MQYLKHLSKYSPWCDLQCQIFYFKTHTHAYALELTNENTHTCTHTYSHTYTCANTHCIHFGNLNDFIVVAEEYVVCQTCGATHTILQKNKRFFFLQYKSCGSSKPVGPKIPSSKRRQGCFPSDARVVAPDASFQPVTAY